MAALSSTLRVSVLGITVAAVVGAPGVALADGPGYGGTANALTVQWRVQVGTKNGGLAVYAVGFRAGSQARLRVGATRELVMTTDSCGALRVLVVRGAPAQSVPPRTVVPTPRAVPTGTAASRSVVSRSVVSNALLGPVPRIALARPVAAQPTDTTVVTVPDDAIGRLSPGTSVLVVGETPTGAVRTLLGSVPPPEAGWGARDLASWAGGAALFGVGVLWLRRRGVVVAGVLQRYRRPARHRA